MIVQIAEWWEWLTPYRKTILLIVWGLGVICVPIMKKIQPDTFWLYLVYVAVVEIGYTAFVVLLSIAEIGL